MVYEIANSKVLLVTALLHYIIYAVIYIIETFLPGSN